MLRAAARGWKEGREGGRKERKENTAFGRAENNDVIDGNPAILLNDN